MLPKDPVPGLLSPATTQRNASISFEHLNIGKGHRMVATRTRLTVSLFGHRKT